MNQGAVIVIVVACVGSSGLWSLFSTLLNNKRDKKHNIGAELDILKQANLAMLHDRLYYLMEKYISDGSINSNEYKNIEYLIKPYFEMGGNGTCEKLWSEIQKLPLDVKGEE